jgi:hypothetical protein
LKVFTTGRKGFDEERKRAREVVDGRNDLEEM